MADNVINTRLKLTTEGNTEAVAAVNQLNTATQQSMDEFIAANRASNELGDSLKKTNVQAEGLRRTGGALSQLGLTGVGQIVSRLGDIQQVSKELGNMTQIIPQLADKIPIVSKAAEALTPALGEMGASITAIAAPAAAAALLIAAITTVLDVFNRAAAEAKELAKEGLTAGLGGLTQYYDVIATGSKQAVEDAKKQADQQVKASQDELTLLKPLSDELKKKMEDPLYALAKAAAGITGNSKAFEDITKSITDPIKTELIKVGVLTQQAAKDISNDDLFGLLKKHVDDLQTSSDAAAANVKKFNDALASGTLADDTKATVEAKKADTNASEEELKAVQKDADAKLKAADEADKLADQEIQLSEQHAALVEQRSQEDYRAAKEAVLNRQIQAAQEAEAAQASADKIVQLRQQAADAEVQAQSKVNDAIAKTNQQAMDNELKLLQNYITTESRATEDYSRNRVRKLQDLYDTLDGLASQRDVAGFVNARKKGLTDIERGDEDFGVEAKRRKEDYERQRAEEESNRQQRIADIESAAQVEAQQRAAQLAQQIQQQQVAGQTQLTQSQQLQKQLADLRDQWAKQDLAARRRTEDDAYRTQIAALQQRQQAITGIVAQTTTPVITFFGNVGSAIVSMVQQVQNAFSGGSTGGGGGGKISSGSASLSAGLRSSSVSGLRVPQTSSGRGDVHVHVGAIGEIVTPSQLNGAVDSIVKGVEMAVGKR